MCIPGTLEVMGDPILFWFYSHHERASICILVTGNKEHEMWIWSLSQRDYRNFAHFMTKVRLAG